MWQEEDNKLKKTFVFDDFREAFRFMVEAGEVINRLNHHPFWCNSYNKVSFELSTHDAGGIVTEKDRQLARVLDSISKQE